MTFAQDWDAISVQMLKKAPSKKPVLSHYPPSENTDFDAVATTPASRLCGPVFATSDLESQIIRLEGASVCTMYSSHTCCTNYSVCYHADRFPFYALLQKYDHTYIETPRFAPFTAAGYFVAHSGTHPNMLPTKIRI